MTKYFGGKLNISVSRIITIIFLLTALIHFSLNASGKVLDSFHQTDSSGINDGPYIFIENNHLIEKRITDGNVIINTTPVNHYKREYVPSPASFNNVNKFAAFSDIHGQFDLATSILRNHKIIDENLEWSFGDGHLVIVGDIMDRGEKVTEFLWFVYHLEQQAKISGGRVHFLLGNHEYMVLRNDLRYIHEKYKTASDLLGASYSDLFSDQTILGRWLRSKPTIIKIDDITFVHGGISKELLSINNDIESINKLMRESIDIPKSEMKDTLFYKSYYRSLGPIWYRGYFKDDNIVNEIDGILKTLESNHIVVGHSSQQNVVELFEGKVYGVDSSIKNGISGELLLFENDRFYRGKMNGEKIEFD
jgi:hypothetical protein